MHMNWKWWKQTSCDKVVRHLAKRYSQSNRDKHMCECKLPVCPQFRMFCQTMWLLQWCTCTKHSHDTIELVHQNRPVKFAQFIHITTKKKNMRIITIHSDWKYITHLTRIFAFNMRPSAQLSFINNAVIKQASNCIRIACITFLLCEYF